MATSLAQSLAKAAEALNGRPCGSGMHHHYGVSRQPACQYVRITCAFCDIFKIQEWCAECLDGVQNSGKRWFCDGCHEHMTKDEKLEHVLRMGDL